MTGLTEVLWKVLPHGLYKHFKINRPARLRRQEEIARLRPALDLAAGNVVFRDCHKGQRCFILCNGPSVSRQNIKPLKDEHVLSVSSGYLHSDFATINPEYHFVPQLTHGVIKKDDAIAWFKEMDARLGRATIFLNCSEAGLVHREGLFPKRDVRYMAFWKSFSDYKPDIKPDLAGPIPGPQSVAVMCLMAAIYMGFTQIYLLGTDHDQFRTGQYTYSFEPTVLRGKDVSAQDNGELIGGWHDELAALAVLWGQYRTMREIAERHGVQIFNASAGGELDEFPRVELSSVLASSDT
jgi:hypothetical protein